jgi:hypothetical protein
MWLEAWKIAEEEKKKQENSEKEKKQEQAKIIEQEKIKKEVREKNQNNTDKIILKRLEEMLDDWELSNDEIDELRDLAWKVDLTKDEIEEILEKIEEIDNTDDIKKYLPDDFRITKDDYIQSLTSPVIREKTLTKINISLNILSNHINPDSSMWLNLFTWYLNILDKKLIKIQENTIDVKQCLEKFETKKQKTFWERLKDFFR